MITQIRRKPKKVNWKQGKFWSGFENNINQKGKKTLAKN